MAESSGRRTALKVILGVGGAAVTALLAVPGLGYVLDPLLRRRPRGGDFVEVGEESALREGKPISLPIIGEHVDAWTRAENQQLGSVWLQKREGELVAFSAVCPHLGCRIGYREDDNNFSCPCHVSAFGLDGSTQSGPSPRPMDQLEARVRDGKIEVKWKRFRTQIEDKVEIG